MKNCNCETQGTICIELKIFIDEESQVGELVANRLSRYKLATNSDAEVVVLTMQRLDERGAMRTILKKAFTVRTNSDATLIQAYFNNAQYENEVPKPYLLSNWSAKASELLPK